MNCEKILIMLFLQLGINEWSRRSLFTLTFIYALAVEHHLGRFSLWRHRTLSNDKGRRAESSVRGVGRRHRKGASLGVGQLRVSGAAARKLLM